MILNVTTVKLTICRIPVTDVSSEHINRVFCALMQVLHNHIGVENASWLCRINFFSVQIIPYVNCDPVKDYILPVAERLRNIAEKAYKDEEHMRTHPDDADEGTVAEVFSMFLFLTVIWPCIIARGVY